MTSDPVGGVISAVAVASIGAEVGLEPGDCLLAINGHPLRDLIDYRYYADDEQLELLVERAGQRHTIEIERDEDETLGLEFAEIVFDGLRECANDCPFCFVRQMPRGMRRSLYVRDDDYRYSFLLGNYVTLTNLDEADWARIGAQHLSPLYVSIHASEPTLRRRLLGNSQAPDVMAQLRRLGGMGIAVHGQVVIVPGMNDGSGLRQTIEEVAGLWPTVRTLALVPVGLTWHCRRALRTMHPEEARDILALAQGFWRARPEGMGTWLYPSDELYLLAREPVPPASFYDDPAQQENGVGLVRLLLDDWRRARRRLSGLQPALRSISLVCGLLIAPTLQALAAELATLTGWRVTLFPIANRFWGDTVTVSGLLTGQDVLDALYGQDLGEVVFLPRAMFDAEGARTLDDMSPAELERQLSVPVRLIERLSEIVSALC
jgi:putative radical SAM enzyme (TIGR03279 family)